MNTINTPSTAHVVFLNRTHDDVARLLGDIKSYMTSQYADDVAALAPGEVLRVHCESTRITTRLTCVMSWMALQQAAQRGQVSHADIQSQHLHFPAQIAYLDYRSDHDLGLPVKLRELLGKSYDLYVRMLRLTQSVQAVQ